MSSRSGSSNGKYQQIARTSARLFVNGYLVDHPCTMCGNTDIRVLQFHHINPKEKLHTVSSMVSKGMSIQNIKREIEKTIVLCSNCHIIHHHIEREQQREVRRVRRNKNKNVLADMHA